MFQKYFDLDGKYNASKSEQIRREYKKARNKTSAPQSSNNKPLLASEIFDNLFKTKIPQLT